MSVPQPYVSDKRSAANLFAAYVEYMKLMLGNLFILNAGSATALIAFFGAYKPEASGPRLVTIDSIKNGVAFMALGALCAILASASIAVVENINSHRVENNNRHYHTGFGYVAFLLALSSTISFSVACLLSVQVSPRSFEAALIR